MTHSLQFFIDGAWVDPVTPRIADVIDPSTEEAFAQVAMGSSADVDRAVAAAREAFPAYSGTSISERLELLQRIVGIYRRRQQEIADAVSREMGAPRPFALNSQVGAGLEHLLTLIEVLKRFRFSEDRGTSRIVKEPIGVVGLITPWNWPLNQIACKIGPALAAGCTMVLKPSEIAPINAILIA